MGPLRFFKPEHALVLNIEEEHLDFYADLAAIEAVCFPKLLDQTSDSVFYCADDPPLPRGFCGARVRVPFPSVLRRPAKLPPERTSICGIFASVFCVFFRGGRRKLGEAVLKRSRAATTWSNSLGVIALAMELGNTVCEDSSRPCGVSSTPVAVLKSSIRASGFLLVGRLCASSHRDKVRPLGGLRSPTGRNRVADNVFSQHRYSRTKALRREFGRAFD